MKAVVRFFALFVAIAGLATASFAPATTKALASRAARTEMTPGSTIGLPAPLPCQSNGSCEVSPTTPQR